jgi:hypothetical protein
MIPFAVDLLALLRRDLHCLIREVEAFPDDAALWRTMPGIGNSAGNLALHVAGNLRHFLGGALGETGYVRDRDREFAQREGSRAEVVALLEAASVELETGLRTLTEEALAQPFPATASGYQLPARRFLLQMSAHLAFHLGQAGYLRRALSGDSRSMGGMSLSELTENL